MERLTKTYADGTYGVADNLPCGENSYDFKELLIRTLGHYENLAEQGRLIELPCKIGDTVYAIINGKVICDIVDRIEVNKHCTKVSTENHSWLCNIESVFSSKDLAEKKLAERNGEHEVN